MTKVLSFCRRAADKPAPSSWALRASLTMVVPEQRQPINDDLQPSGVCNVWLGKIEVTDDDVRRDSASCLLADPNSHGLQRVPQGHSRRSARSREEGDGGDARKQHETAVEGSL